MQYGAHGDGKTDDSQAFINAFNSACKATGMSTLVIPAGKTFMVSKVIFSGRCNAKVRIQLEGQIVAPSKANSKAQSYWFTIEYVNGLTIDGNGQGGLDGDGSTWWESGGERPGVQALLFHSCNDLSVSNLRITNSPSSHVSINMCNRTTFSHVSINSPATSPNTDGFDISFSTDIRIENSNIKSGDDCIAVNGGSNFINVTGVTCGPGHGISVGSLGKKRTNDQVSDVHVRNCTFKETQNGARIKTVPGGSGYARHITYDQIILVNVKNSIIIDQYYNDIIPQAGDVSVSDVTYRGFTGTSANDLAIQLNCGSSG
ncbi:probable polygalacturonase At3g15720 [Medicago truncatula]|uniref:probable polygalacturonase At3g15720 n=1 Tax=Medicago truncatula TaxID=3880 RepID=UPI000D2F1AF6|nr:probable polygalacturonase At3g15720 [Medicago truncatula]